MRYFPKQDLQNELAHELWLRKILRDDSIEGGRGPADVKLETISTTKTF